MLLEDTVVVALFRPQPTLRNIWNSPADMGVLFNEA